MVWISLSYSLTLFPSFVAISLCVCVCVGTTGTATVPAGVAGGCIGIHSTHEKKCDEAACDDVEWFYVRRLQQLQHAASTIERAAILLLVVIP
jgi:hypothetical protein